MLQVTAQPPMSAAPAAIPCMHSVPPVQSAIDVNAPRTSGHVPMPPPPPAPDGGSPVGAMLPLD
eukprot:1154220-Prymnesium_polylepis.1